ncbi:MAG: hypothetical protein PHT62_04615 [Desulfotomaculaceae bacterium]|nr:hypothetical protein [Desulfotomaculaceae bacterium]
MRGVEKTSRLQVNALICNTNLGCQTDAKIILEGVSVVSAVAGHLGLPVAFIAARSDLADQLGTLGARVLPIDIFMKPPWEDAKYHS